MKKDRPEGLPRFHTFTDVNNFIRGAIWLLHRDSGGHTRSQFAVCTVIGECEDSHFLKEEIEQATSTPEKVVDAANLLRRYKDKLAFSVEVAHKLCVDYGIDVSPRTVQRDHVANGGRHLAEELKWQWQPRSRPDREPVELFVAPGGEATPRKRSAAVSCVPASVEEPQF